MAQRAVDTGGRTAERPCRREHPGVTDSAGVLRTERHTVASAAEEGA